MKNLSVLVVILYATLALGAGAENTVNGDAQLEATVKQIGIGGGYISSDLALLQKQPHQAATLLVKELHPIPPKMYYSNVKTEESRHIIACLRALHYLTGLTFTATSSEKLTDDQKQFVDFDKQMHDRNPSHKLHFFGVWMSRDAECVAPIDAQRKIVKHWQQWQAAHAETFQPAHSGNPADFMEEWYWFG